MYKSKFVNPIIHLESRPRFLDGLNEKVSPGWVSLNSSVSYGFVWFSSKSVSKFLVIESNKSSVLFLRLNVSRFIQYYYILINRQVKIIVSPLKSTGLWSPSSK